MIKTTFHDKVRICKLKNGKYEQFDVCCTENSGLDYFNNPKLKFIGSGVYYSLDGVPANDDTFRYFFVRVE